MEWSSGRRGCAILVLLLALLVGIFIYFGWQSRSDAPSPSQGYFPPDNPAAANRG